MKKCLALLLAFNIYLLKAQFNLQPYWGNLHSHTSYSDGVQTPNEAFQHAKNVAGLNFLAITDHMEQLSSSELSQCNNFAIQHTQNGVFIAFCGYEWSSPYYGHVNVFNTTEEPSVTTYSNWSGFRQWLIDRPSALAQFNHPGDESYFNNWYDFEYKGAETDSCFPLIEFQSVQQANDWYELALNKGWHLSPVWNQDNHSADWGTKNNCRAGVWLSQLTYNDLIDGLRKGRTFATMDKNASILLISNNSIMGSTTHRLFNMPFRILLTDSNSEAYSSIELRSSNGLLFSFTANGNIDTILHLTLYTEKYIYIKATQTDGDIIWSSPIYLDGILYQKNIESNEQKFYLYYHQNNLFYRTLKEGNYQLNIFSITGQNLFTQNIYANETISSLPMQLNKGIYFIKVENSEITFLKKIVIH